MEGISQRAFLTRRIDFDELKICFYSDMEEGEYIIIDNIELTVYYGIIALEKRRGRYDFFFLMYSEKKKELMKLFPCYYTKRKMVEYYDMLKEDDNIFILEKEERKQGVRRPPSPKWYEASFPDYFERNHQFRHTNEYDNVELVKRGEKRCISE